MPFTMPAQNLAVTTKSLGKFTDWQYIYGLMDTSAEAATRPDHGHHAECTSPHQQRCFPYVQNARSER